MSINPACRMWLVMGDIILIIVMVLVALVLVTGIVVMARGGEANRKYANKLMALRVIMQGAALALLGLLFFLDK
jgi:hypothetical protein